MIFELTKQEVKDLREAKARFNKEPSIENMDAIEAIIEKANQKRFDKLQGDPAAILENAREQLPLIFEDSLKSYITISDAALIESYIKAGYIVKEAEQYKLSIFDAVVSVTEELKLHFESLGGTEYREELTKLVNDAIASSPIVSDDPNTAHLPGIEKETDKPIRNRRTMTAGPLAYRQLPQIKKYGIMRDASNIAIRGSGFVGSELIDGQMRMIFEAEQHPAKRGNDAVPIYITLTYQAGETSKKITKFDDAVISAISTLNYYWQIENPGTNLIFSINEVFRVMNGKAPNDKTVNAATKQAERIEACIDKLRFTRLEMDITEDIRQNDFSIDDDRVHNGEIDANYLHADVWKANTKTKKHKKYILFTEPFIYTYNLVKGHIQYVPLEMLDTTDMISNSENVAEFRLYLLSQIMLMKSGDRHGNNRILLETIYQGSGVKVPEDRVKNKNETTRAALVRQARNDDNKKIEAILQSWKNRGEIKDFIINKGKQKKTISYDIILPDAELPSKKKGKSLKS